MVAGGDDGQWGWPVVVGGGRWWLKVVDTCGGAGGDGAY